MRLQLVIAHQYVNQLPDPTRAAVFGNVGSMVVFAVGAEDAEQLATALGKFPGQVRPEDLGNLPKYTAIARVLHDGLPTPPFTLSSLPPPAMVEDRSAIVLRASQRRHGQFAMPR